MLPVDGGDEGSEIRIHAVLLAWGFLFFVFVCLFFATRNTGRILKKLLRVVTYGGVNLGRGDRQRPGWE